MCGVADGEHAQPPGGVLASAEPGVMGGVMPCGPLNEIGMLTDYVTPDERFVACPNQDVVYGFGILSLDVEPAVVQVPDIGDRFWVYQIADQRTDAFGGLGQQYGTQPAITSWSARTGTARCRTGSCR